MLLHFQLKEGSEKQKLNGKAIRLVKPEYPETQPGDVWSGWTNCSFSLALHGGTTIMENTGKSTAGAPADGLKTAKRLTKIALFAKKYLPGRFYLKFLSFLLNSFYVLLNSFY